MPAFGADGGEHVQHQPSGGTSGTEADALFCRIFYKFKRDKYIAVPRLELVTANLAVNSVFDPIRDRDFNLLVDGFTFAFNNHCCSSFC
jgi:hypothetical protein